MKKIELILLACVLLLALSACRQPSPDSKEAPKSNLVAGEDYFYEEGIYRFYHFSDDGKAWGELPDSDGNAVPDALVAISVATEQLEKEKEKGQYKDFVLSGVFYDTEDLVWVVSFNKEPLVPGGSYNVAIFQKTGEILAEGYWGE